MAPEIIEAILYDRILDRLSVRNYTDTKILTVWQEPRCFLEWFDVVKRINYDCVETQDNGSAGH